MLSDQQGKACATGQKEAEKKFINDSLVCWLLCLCNFFEQSFGSLVRWHADLFLLLHFCSCSFICLAAAGFAIDRLEGDGI